MIRWKKLVKLASVADPGIALAVATIASVGVSAASAFGAFSPKPPSLPDTGKVPGRDDAETRAAIAAEAKRDRQRKAGAIAPVQTGSQGALLKSENIGLRKLFGGSSANG